MNRLLLLVLILAVAPAASGQALSDTLFVWEDYGREARCRVRVYPAPDEERPYTVVLQELAENTGRSASDDLPLVAELVGRRLGVDAAAATWVVHWGTFSFSGADGGEKELFVRATFRRGASGRLGAPTWRLLTRAEVEELTDRQFR